MNRKKEYFHLILGTIIFCLGTVVFLRPLNIYNGGFLGVSQLIGDTLLKNKIMGSSFDISGIINLILNIYILSVAYFKLSKKLVFRTILVLVFQSVFIGILSDNISPIQINPIFSLIIGTLFVGLGTLIVFNSKGSGGGLDVIALLYLKIKNVSISKVYLIFNTMIYTLCLLLYGGYSAIYSMIHGILLSFLLKFQPN